jgi:methanogenic corrinoid protein MtbC1
MAPEFPPVPGAPFAAGDAEPSGSLHSIGDVATATGISPDTLRIWERRYGRPEPVRLPSGHRRYTAEQLAWLRRVAEAMAQGNRPSTVVCATDHELERLLGARASPGVGDPVTFELLALVVGFRGEELTARLLEEWGRLGAEAFLERRIAPLLEAIGRGWARGELDVRHEHFSSEVLADLLRALRAGLVGDVPGPTVVLATLPEELHGLGLQMCALVCTLVGARARVLGVATPVGEIASAATELGADAVAISVSLASGGVETDRRLADLRRALPSDVSLLVGGEGARGVRRGPRGVEYLSDFEALRRWLRARAAPACDALPRGFGRG